jgi:hypothetical protein
MPPSFVDVRARPSGATDVLFEAFVAGDPGVNIDSVWITYTDTTSPYPRVWRSIDLVRDTSQVGYWKATNSLTALGAESFDDLVFIAQAVNASGLVGFATNSGAYYRVETPVAIVSAPKRATELALVATPAAPTRPCPYVPPTSNAAPIPCAYRSTATFTARLLEVVPGESVPLAGRSVRFRLGSQQLAAVTNENGEAMLDLKLLQRPGSYRLNVAFDEDASNLASSNSGAYTIVKAVSSIALAQDPLTVTTGGTWSAAATLGIAGGAPIETQTVFFVATGGTPTRTYVTTTLTGLNGAATIPGWDLPVGSYSLTAYFATSVPLGGGASYDATSLYYLGSEDTGVLHVTAAGISYAGDTVVQIGTNINLRALVTPPAGANADLAKVRYVVKRGGSTVFATAPVARGTGNWLATIVGGLPAAVYAVHTSIVGTNYSGTGEVAYISVYDPSGGFVTGGGWINSPAGALAADPNRVGKATFGFNAKYKKGTTDVTGDTEFHFSAGDLKFVSSSHESTSLVIAGRKALYKGKGTINGSGDYRFTVYAVDGQANKGVGPDTFRIKIIDAATGNVAYDNQMGAGEGDDPTTTLGGGSIVIHK